MPTLAGGGYCVPLMGGKKGFPCSLSMEPSAAWEGAAAQGPWPWRAPTFILREWRASTWVYCTHIHVCSPTNKNNQQARHVLLQPNKHGHAQKKWPEEKRQRESLIFCHPFWPSLDSSTSVVSIHERPAAATIEAWSTKPNNYHSLRSFLIDSDLV
jgi:hypothetical protein